MKKNHNHSFNVDWSEKLNKRILSIKKFNYQLGTFVTTKLFPTKKLNKQGWSQESFKEAIN